MREHGMHLFLLNTTEGLIYNKITDWCLKCKHTLMEHHWILENNYNLEIVNHHNYDFGLPVLEQRSLRDQVTLVKRVLKQLWTHAS